MTTRAYNGSFPGPVLRVRRGDRVAITLLNNLGGDDDSADGSEQLGAAAVITNLHLHGMHVPATPYNPTAHTCGDNVVECSVAPQHSLRYDYVVDNDHPTGTYWYHPHMHGTTALQVGGLMAGTFSGQ